MEVIRFLAHRHQGYSRDEIAKRLGTSPNGEFSKILKALEGSGFIQQYVPFGSKKISRYISSLTHSVGFGCISRKN